MKINYVSGDATNPQGGGIKLIPHITNDVNKWGAGFVLALSKKWKAPEETFRKNKFSKLGQIDIVQVEDNIYVINMYAQHDIRTKTLKELGAINISEKDNIQIPPIRYDALKLCLIQVNNLAIKLNATLHCPMFGAGLAGGNWDEIEKIIEDVITVPVTIYVFDNKNISKYIKKYI